MVPGCQPGDTVSSLHGWALLLPCRVRFETILMPSRSWVTLAPNCSLLACVKSTLHSGSTSNVCLNLQEFKKPGKDEIEG